MYAGIKWAYETIPAYAKMLVGEFTRTNLKGDVKFTEQRERRLCQVVGDLYPQFVDFYKNNARNVRPMGYTLTHRASFCVKPSEGKRPEIERFERPEWLPHLGVVKSAIEKNMRIHDDDIAHATEKGLIIVNEGIPGVYFRRDPHRSDLLYIGMASDISARNRGHQNSPMFLAQVVATGNTEAAKILENVLHSCATRIGAEPFRDGSRGLFKFPTKDAIVSMNNHMRDDATCRALLRSVMKNAK